MTNTTTPARPLGSSVRCTHRDGHELALDPAEALPIEAHRECPCCGARLWLSLPSVGEILAAVARGTLSTVPDLSVQLTPREQQLLHVLHRSPYPLRHSQLAALVWSDPDREHDVRSTLYRLRAKLDGSAWAIPIPPRGQGVRLLHLQPDTREPDQGGPESRSAPRRSAVRVLAELTAAGATVSRPYWKRLAGRQSEPSERRQPLVEPRTSRP